MYKTLKKYSKNIFLGLLSIGNQNNLGVHRRV